MTGPLPRALRQRLEAVARSPHLLVCSDYDGTLAPLADRPENARLLPGAFELLHALARLPDTRVAVISGRARDNLMGHSGLADPVQLVGSHGAELPGRPAIASDLACQLDTMVEALSPLCTKADGAWLERKPFGIAFHVRGIAEPDACRLLVAARDIANRWPTIHLTDGKAVVELSVATCTKGDAMHQLAEQWGTRPRLVFLGDDITDEHGFAALTMEDVGIKVGPGASRAGYRVACEAEALAALQLIFSCRAEHIGCQGSGIFMPESKA